MFIYGSSIPLEAGERLQTPLSAKGVLTHIVVIAWFVSNGGGTCLLPARVAWRIRSLGRVLIKDTCRDRVR